MHALKTGSIRAKKILENWDEEKESFVKVMPRDYKKALQAKAADRKAPPKSWTNQSESKDTS